VARVSIHILFLILLPRMDCVRSMRSSRISIHILFLILSHVQAVYAPCEICFVCFRRRVNWLCRHNGDKVLKIKVRIILNWMFVLEMTHKCHAYICKKDIYIF